MENKFRQCKNITVCTNIRMRKVLNDQTNRDNKQAIVEREEQERTQLKMKQRNIVRTCHMRKGTYKSYKNCIADSQRKNAVSTYP